MLGSATTTPGDRDRNLQPAPPMLVLQPAHLRFYGIDADHAIPSRRQLPKGSGTPTSSNRSLVLPSTAVVGSANQPLSDVHNSSSGGDADRNASTSRGSPKADAPTSQGCSPRQRSRTEVQQALAGNQELGVGEPPPCHRRGKLPLAPPALSARCQLHPAVMRDLGLNAGDPALVLALAKGWISDGNADDATANSHLSADPVGSIESHGQGGCHTPGGFPAATLEDDKQQEAGHEISSVDLGEVELEVEACRRGVESLRLAAKGGGEQLGHHGRAEEARKGKHKQQQQHEHRQPTQPRDQEQRRIAAASLSDRVAENLTCFLCTAWTNPHLTLGEAAVDGRVSIPLPWTTTATRGDLDVSQPGHPAGVTEPATEGRSPRPNDAAAPPFDDIIARFLRAAGDRHFLALGANVEDGIGDGEPVVGIIPVSALCDGAYGVGTISGGRGGRSGDAPPVAGRVSARVLAGGTRRKKGGIVAVGGERVVAGGVRGAVRSPGEERAALCPAEGQEAATLQQGKLQHQQFLQQREQQQQQQQQLLPAYTSLVKRSLRHLVVSNGCEVAVPSCPNRIGTTLEGSGANRRSSTGSVTGTGQQPGKGDGTSPVRIEINGGGGSGGVLAGLFGGAVCVVGPESLILVEDGQSAVNGAVDTHKPGLRKGGWCEGGKTRHDDDQRSLEGIHAYSPKTSNLTPTDALVELMLLPMTAKPVPLAQGDRGLKPLEFSLPRGVLLTGPPGVGKTFAVRSAVERVRNFGSSREGKDDGPFEVKLTTLNGAEILSLGQWEACQALREAFSAAESWSKGHDTGGRGFGETTNKQQQQQQGDGKSGGSRCAVIFLDEADALLARRDRDGDKAGGGEGARALAQLLTLMDGFHGAGGSSHVIVIGATNRPGALDPALRRPGRFDQELALAPPDVQGRADILRHHLRGVKVVGGKSTIDAVALSCVGFVGADLAALAREAALLAARSQASHQVHQPEKYHILRAAAATPMEATVEPAHLSAAMEKVGASSLRGHQVTVPRTPWSDIGGMEEAKAKLRQAVEWPVANKAAFDRMGLTPPRGILLFGPPGCSKTTLVRAAATAAGATFVCLSGADVFSPYLGEAEAAVRQAFRIARNAAPALLFFDELDAIVCKRGGVGDKGSANSAESRVLATFLTEMDGVGSLRGDGVVVVGATNRPEAVDRALLRPGRFDQVVYAPLPEEDARRQIFEVHTKKMAVDRDGVDFLTLASVSKGLTGAEIEGVCREAAMSAIREEGFGSDVDTSAGGKAGDQEEASNMQQGAPRSEKKDKTEEQDNEAAGGGGTEKTQGEDIEEERPARRGATVTMRHLMAAARAAAARPGVTREMISAYDRFAAGL